MVVALGTARPDGARQGRAGLDNSSQGIIFNDASLRAARLDTATPGSSSQLKTRNYMKKKQSKSEFSTKEVPQHARYVKGGYYTIPELRALLSDLETHVRIQEMCSEGTAIEVRDEP